MTGWQGETATAEFRVVTGAEAFKIALKQSWCGMERIDFASEQNSKIAGKGASGEYFSRPMGLWAGR